ncbi:RSPRY1 [Symbiodinium sp. CCMP2592]|nr:RSPRY1 [Symbiodinium sp. CCMP2592]
MRSGSDVFDFAVLLEECCCFLVALCLACVLPNGRDWLLQHALTAGIALLFWLICLLLPVCWANLLSTLVQIALATTCGMFAFEKVSSAEVFEANGKVAHVFGFLLLFFCGYSIVALPLVGLKLTASVVLGDDWEWEPPGLLQLKLDTNTRLNLASFQLYHTLPLDCGFVQHLDMVRNATLGTSCAQWCRKGDWFLPVWGGAHLTCFKTEIWWALQQVNVEFWVLAILYMLPSMTKVVAAACRSHSHSQYEQVVEAETEMGLARALKVVADVSPLEAAKRPSSTTFDERGPFYQPGMDFVARVVRCCTTNDLEAAQLTMRVAILLHMLELFGDVSSCVSCMIALFALARTPSIEFISFSFVSLCTTVVTSSLLSIPTGSKASSLLDAQIDLHDYYLVSQAKKGMRPGQKFLTAATVMSLGCFGGTMLCITSVHNNRFNSLFCHMCGGLAVIFLFLSKTSAGSQTPLCRVSLEKCLELMTVLCLSAFWVLVWVDLVQRHDDRFREPDKWFIRRWLISLLGAAATLSTCCLSFSSEWRLRLEGLTGLKPQAADFEQGRVGIDQWVTVGCPQLAQASGKLYYEMELLGDFTNPQVGWLTTSFESGDADSRGVGDDTHGWAFDGARKLWWHNGKKKLEMAAVWERGDVLGFALDLDSGEMSCLSRHGIFGMSFHVPAGQALYPAVSINGFFRLNLAESTWKLDAPQGYQEWGRGEYSWTVDLSPPISLEDAAADDAALASGSFHP